MAADPDPIEIAARALQHRDRSRRQLEERLERAGIGEDGRTEALETLERIGYVNDERYALARAVALADRGFGDEGIRHQLESDGVQATAAEAALAALEPEIDRAAHIVARRGPGLKTAAHLARKGFGEDALEAARAAVGSGER